MKIAYTLTENLHPGLKNKIFGQVELWESMGHHVDLVSHRDGMIFNTSGQVLYRDTHLAGRDYQLLKKMNAARRLSLLKEQYRFLASALARLAPDLTYTRYAFPFMGLQKAFANGKPYVIEINSDDRTEYYIKHRSTGIYNHLFRRQFFSNASGLVFVTCDLSRSSSFRKFKASREVIANGIDTRRFPFLEQTGNRYPQLCFVGSPNQRWHGLRQLGQIAVALPEATVHVIGPSWEEYLASGGRPSENMVFHGYLEDTAVKDTVAAMDVGISTLALYETRMNEACPLKARQYFAQGIPTIGCYRDTDIQEGPFYLRLPNTPNNVKEGVGAIRTFVRNVHGNVLLRQKTRRFAECVLDTRIKEKKRTSFFEKISHAR